MAYTNAQLLALNKRDQPRLFLKVKKGLAMTAAVKGLGTAIEVRPQLTEVVPGLHVGQWKPGMSVGCLRQLGVTHVLNLTAFEAGRYFQVGAG